MTSDKETAIAEKFCLRFSEEQRMVRDLGIRFGHERLSSRDIAHRVPGPLPTLGLEHFLEAERHDSPTGDDIATALLAEELGAADLEGGLATLLDLIVSWFVGLDPSQEPADPTPDRALGIPLHGDAGGGFWTLGCADAATIALLGAAEERNIRIVETESLPAGKSIESGFTSLHLTWHPAGPIAAQFRPRSTDALDEAYRSSIIALAAVILGAMRAAVKFCYGYAGERRSFGKPIILHQAVAMRLADMLTTVEATKLLLWHVASDRAGTGSDRYLVRQIEVASRDTFRDTVQVCGGHGYVQGLPAAKWFQTGAILRLLLAEIEKSWCRRHTDTESPHQAVTTMPSGASRSGDDMGDQPDV